MANPRRVALAAAVGFLVVGCGRDVGEVSGKVTLGGKPLPGAWVTFQPENGARPSVARTDDSGRYELVRTEKVKGAAVGKHKVSITTSGESDDEGKKSQVVAEKVPARYNVKSELVREVKAGRNKIDFDLDAKGEVIDPSKAPPPPRAVVCGGEVEDDKTPPPADEGAPDPAPRSGE
ncbi:carboxypeptidase regulatory-like domain-containing protein [bacterium]|nr:carboxypeptidase regulatory-like domain-containing protein [bacterium]